MIKVKQVPVSIEVKQLTATEIQLWSNGVLCGAGVWTNPITETVMSEATKRITETVMSEATKRIIDARLLSE